MASHAESFYVTLPSNASGELYPDNTNGAYRTRLDRPLKVSRGQWTVGVSEILYTKSWKNVDVGRITWYDSGQLPSPSGGSVRQGYRRYTKSIPTGRYDSIDQIDYWLTRMLRSTALGSRLSLAYDEVSNRVNVTLDGTDGRIRNVSFSRDLCEILGFDTDVRINPPGLRATRGVELERGMIGLFVYSNVISNRLVGDAYAPLLRVVPIEAGISAHADTMVEFRNVQYHDAANFYGQEIEIRLCRDNGETVRFDDGKVIVTLHFKKTGISDTTLTNV